MEKLAVIAIGGNSLIKDSDHQEVDDQLAAIRETVAYIVDFIAEGWQTVITHGNGPQVGFILRRSEIAFESRELHFVPLKNCVADTQDALGYQIQESLTNEFCRRGLAKAAVSVVTLVEVDPGDPSFASPTKPIGAFYSRQKAQSLSRRHPDWRFADDPGGRGLRRVVPSPEPLRIVEVDAIRTLVSHGFCVVAAGGGGIPVVRDASGNLTGVDAVVDKDLSASLLATALDAGLLVVSTAVDRVYLDFGGTDQRDIATMTVAEARRYAGQGHFGRGSMLPKIQAAIRFLESGGQRVVITNPENLKQALGGAAGTHIVP